MKKNSLFNYVNLAEKFQLSQSLNLKWRHKMEYELEEVERDYIEFRKEIGEQ